MGACTSKDGAATDGAVVKKSDAKNQTAFKSCEELVDFSTFFKPENTSSLARFMTKEIWEEYKDQSCEAGVSFKVCIFSGIKNQDSGIGCYAGSHSSYQKFNKLFDQVILDYHGHAHDATHQSDMTSEGLENDELPEEDAAMIVSTRIRVGRNLKAYPLGPGVTKEQRLEIMNKVTEAAANFDDDLKGEFYPLEGMSKET